MPIPPLSEIQIIDDWTDDSHEVCISVIHSKSEYVNSGAGFKSFDQAETVEIHLFVKKLTEDRPDIIDDIEKNIFDIIATNATSLTSEGISVMIPEMFIDVSNRDNSSVYWHSLMQIKLIYRKFVT